MTGSINAGGSIRRNLGAANPIARPKHGGIVKAIV
jgi:hypothetical protein